MDDKAKIPVSEPACPKVATSHMKKALTKKNVNLEPRDHNYQFCKYHAVGQSFMQHSKIIKWILL